MADLITVACETAMKAAAKYLQVNGKTTDVKVLLASIRSNIKARLPEALADAKAAIGLGMEAIAGQTFAASMALAGIDAAKECCTVAA